MATWYIKNGNLPYLEEFPDLDFDNPISDYPNQLWRIKNGNLPYMTTFPELKTIDDYPVSMWVMKDGELPYKTPFPPLSMITDAPSSMWRIDPDKQGDEYHIPWKSVFPDMSTLGAFCHASSIQAINIKSNVQEIGRFAFTNTSITEVTLPTNCTYYSTSFPSGCTVTGGTLIS